MQDFAAWPYGGSPTYANQRTALFNAIQARRNAFANDARVPGNQPAAPNIVINEIQHSPAAGNGAEFLELTNPSATAIDISGWTISDGITLTVQPGTVIPAGGRMTFVSNDVTFKSTYGTTVFVGGRFTGDLAASETLTLLRADGSTADQVTYGGAGWPVPTTGQSLELTNAAADNNDGANWALSASAGNPWRGQRQRLGRHTPRRADHRHRDARQRVGDGDLDAARQHRRRADHRILGAGGQQRDQPASGRAAPCRRGRDQSRRHRADQPDRLPLPGPRDEQRR